MKCKYIRPHRIIRITYIVPEMNNRKTIKRII